VYIYIAHYQKISALRSLHLVNMSKKVCLQLTPKHVETQCWVAKTVM